MVFSVFFLKLRQFFKVFLVYVQLLPLEAVQHDIPTDGDGDRK